MRQTSARGRNVQQIWESDDARWRAVAARDAAADGAFVFSVRSTGIYCRPGCPARLPLRKNVCFHASAAEAEAAGFRPCQRCRPSGDGLAAHQTALVARTCRLIEQADGAIRSDELARAVDVSPSHLRRLFKSQTGLTPRQYAAARRTQRIHNALHMGQTVTQAMYDAGFNSPGRFYAHAPLSLGMRPRTFRSGGAGESIHFAVGECWLGSILVAATPLGVCAVLLGEDPAALLRELQDRFPQAELIGDDETFQQTAAVVIGQLEAPSAGADLPLDIRGTAFQCRVWEALRRIPPGTTATYAEVARSIGRPGATRAVGRACATNPVAIAIPCHRVVRTDGALSGYYWGIDRKARLLKWEREREQR